MSKILVEIIVGFFRYLIIPVLPVFFAGEPPEAVVMLANQFDLELFSKCVNDYPGHRHERPPAEAAGAFIILVRFKNTIAAHETPVPLR